MILTKRKSPKGCYGVEQQRPPPGQGLIYPIHTYINKEVGNTIYSGVGYTLYRLVYMTPVRLQRTIGIVRPSMFV